jgi:hypothetical protein
MRFFFSHGSFQNFRCVPFFSIMAYHIPPFPTLVYEYRSFPQSGPRLPYLLLFHIIRSLHMIYIHIRADSHLGCHQLWLLSVVTFSPSVLCFLLQLVLISRYYAIVGDLILLFGFNSWCIKYPFLLLLFDRFLSTYLPAIPFGDCDWVSSVPTTTASCKSVLRVRNSSLRFLNWALLIADLFFAGFLWELSGGIHSLCCS